MPEPLYEAERAAWIKGRRWWDRNAAMRRADLLSRAARKRERERAGVGDSALHEEITKGRFAQWTHHDDSKTSALGAIAFVMLFCYALPLILGLAWVISHASYGVWCTVLRGRSTRPWALVLGAAALTGSAVVARWLGLDLVIIHRLAAVYEDVSGGLLAPAALSRWYAAGTVSWVEAQIVAGLIWGAYRTWAWGWLAPSVLRATATAANHGRTTSDASVRILGGAAATAPVATTTSADPDSVLEDPVIQILPDPLTDLDDDTPEVDDLEPDFDEPQPDFEGLQDLPFDDIDLDSVMQIIPTVTTTEKEPS